MRRFWRSGAWGTDLEQRGLILHTLLSQTLDEIIARRRGKFCCLKLPEMPSYPYEDKKKMQALKDLQVPEGSSPFLALRLK